MASQTAPASAPTTTTVIKWVLDTRCLWPEAKETKHLPTAAARALALLAEDEQADVLRFYFVRDAKLALGSSLLKRLAISRYAGVGWDAARWSRDARTKPVFRLPDGSEPLLFNISHQAGVVALLGVHGPPGPGTAIGVDVVCPAERRARDHAAIAADGWPCYVDVHAEVLSPAEVARLKALATHPDMGLDRRLSYFYALWCLREAYVKMTGDALLAPWLHDLDMRYFAPPGQKPPEQRPLEIWFRDARVDDVDMRLEPLLDDFMICTAFRWPGDYGPHDDADMAKPFAFLTMDEVLAEAEASRATDGMN